MDSFAGVRAGDLNCVLSAAVQGKYKSELISMT